jgi:hypothetical protein
MLEGGEKLDTQGCMWYGEIIYSSRFGKAISGIESQARIDDTAQWKMLASYA